jgi:hypothetical protein
VVEASGRGDLSRFQEHADNLVEFLPAGDIHGVLPLLPRWTQNSIVNSFIIISNCFLICLYLVFDVGGTAGGDEDPSQLATAHGGGDVQGRVSVLVFLDPMN